MFPKKLFITVLLLSAFGTVAGCATSDKPIDRTSVGYRSASEECVRWGYRRGGFEHNRCVEKILGVQKED